MKTIKNVTILGGGSSGWMTAAALSKEFPEIEVTLVESKSKGTIGVGESTLGSFTDFIEYLGIDKDRDKWMPACNATYKLSIDFTNWDKAQSFRARTPLTQGASLLGVPKDHWFISDINTTPSGLPYHTFGTSWGALLEYNKLGYTFNDFSIKNQGAFHLDATLFGEYLKNNMCPKVKNVIGTVQKVEKHPTGDISCLILSSGKKVGGDLFIDCSGFSRRLISQEMGADEVALGSTLINNKAIATHVEYLDKDTEMEHSTNATTLPNGWVWNIPLWNHIGTGYVYSNKFTNKEKALREFKQHLSSKKGRTEEYVEGLKYLFLDINPSRVSKSWVGNVCAIGLSGGFVEPLGSTGLHLTIQNIIQLLESMRSRRGCTDNITRGIFNAKAEDTWKYFGDFISAHFALATRSDTNYWKHVTQELEYKDNYLFKTIAEHRLEDLTEGDRMLLSSYGMNPYYQHAYYAQGGSTLEYDFRKALKNQYQKECNKATHLRSHYQFLKDTIYAKK